MAAHTPAPWTLQPCSHGGQLLRRGAFTDGRMTHPQPSLQIVPDADAHLIAAAPDLLEALRELRINANRLCDRQLGGTYEDDCRRSLKAAEAAIDKALGLAKAEGR